MRSSSSLAPTAPTRNGSTACTTGTRRARHGLPRSPSIVRVSTHGVPDRTVGPDGRGGGGHHPVLPGQGPPGSAAPRRPSDVVRRRPPGSAAPDPGAAAARIQPDRDPAVPGRRALALRRGPRGGRGAQAARDLHRAARSQRHARPAPLRAHASARRPRAHRKTRVIATTPVRTWELERTPHLVDLVSAARDAGHEVLLIERPMPDAVSVAALGRAFDIVAAAGGGVLRAAKGAGIELDP